MRDDTVNRLVGRLTVSELVDRREIDFFFRLESRPHFLRGLPQALGVAEKQIRDTREERCRRL